jgi:hypothetical protein
MNMCDDVENSFPYEIIIKKKFLPTKTFHINERREIFILANLK